MLWYMSTRIVSVPVSNSPEVDPSCTAALQVDMLSWEELGSVVVTQKQLAAVVSLVAAASGAQRVH